VSFFLRFQFIVSLVSFYPSVVYDVTCVFVREREVGREGEREREKHFVLFHSFWYTPSKAYYTTTHYGMEDYGMITCVPIRLVPPYLKTP
jgi:hypothetical protein